MQKVRRKKYWRSFTVTNKRFSWITIFTMLFISCQSIRNKSEIRFYDVESFEIEYVPISFFRQKVIEKNDPPLTNLRNEKIDIIVIEKQGCGSTILVYFDYDISIFGSCSYLVLATTEAFSKKINQLNVYDIGEYSDEDLKNVLFLKEKLLP